MKSREMAALVLMTAIISPVMAQEDGTHFSHKDWEVVCDNTHTCRAAGYSNDGWESGGSVLLTRLAGPAQMPTGEVVLAEIESDSIAPGATLQLWIDDKSRGALKKAKDDVWHLSKAQTMALIAAVKGSGKVEFKGGTAPFVLSGEGAYAALLKMDDIQGRVGTSGALAKKGNKPESSVPAAIPAPVIQMVKIKPAQERPLTAPEIEVLKPKLLATLSQDDCERLQPAEDNDEQESSITLTPLNDGHAVVSALCWRAAYNEGYGYWVIDGELKGTPVLVTTSGSDYGDGVISYSHKGRGLGDCWGSASWVWDGQVFRKSSEATTGMCRYIRLGGTWDLPTFVTDVKPAQ